MSNAGDGAYIKLAVYLENVATSPPDPRVVVDMVPSFTE